MEIARLDPARVDHVLVHRIASPRPLRPATAACGAAAMGLALGIAGRASDYLPPLVRWGASLGVPWLAAAFLLGALVADRRTAAWAGAVALVVGVETYYAIFLAIEHATTPGYAVTAGTAWSLAGVAAGAAFGYAGAVWRCNRPSRRAAAIAVLSGALIGEATLLLAVWHSAPARRVLLIEFALGALLPLLLARGVRTRALAMALTASVAIAVLAVEAAVREAARAAGWAGA